MLSQGVPFSVLRLAIILSALLVPAAASAVVGGKVQVDAAWRAALVDLDREADPVCTASGGSENFCKQFCAGSLVAPRWVVTAAHCVDGIANLSALRVALGSNDLNDPAIDLYGVTWKFVKSTYGRDGVTYADDIALLHLDRDADYAFASLSTSDFETSLLASAASANDELVVAGWGRLGPAGAFPEELHTVALDLMAPEQCGLIYNGPFAISFVDSVMFCASEPDAAALEPDDAGDSTPDDPAGEDACQLDSGGGLLARSGNAEYLAGLVSFGARDACGNADVPSVYTRISPFLAWMESQALTIPDKLGDLALEVSVPLSAAPGGNRSATVNLVNRSATSTFPAVDFTIAVSGAATIAQTSVSGLTCDAPVGGSITCHRTTTLNANQTVQVVVSIAPSGSSEEFTDFTGSITTSSYSDYRAINNSFARRLTWTTQPDIAITSAVAAGMMAGGQGQAQLYVTVENRSAHASASGLVLGLGLPTGTVLALADGASCVVETGQCSLEPLAAGATRDLEFTLVSAQALDGDAGITLSSSAGDFPTGDTSATVAIAYNKPANSGGGAGGGGGAPGAWMLVLLGLLGVRRFTAGVSSRR